MTVLQEINDSVLFLAGGYTVCHAVYKEMAPRRRPERSYAEEYWKTLGLIIFGLGAIKQTLWFRVQ